MCVWKLKIMWTSFLFCIWYRNYFRLSTTETLHKDRNSSFGTIIRTKQFSINFKLGHRGDRNFSFRSGFPEGIVYFVVLLNFLQVLSSSLCDSNVLILCGSKGVLVQNLKYQMKIFLSSVASFMLVTKESRTEFINLRICPH